ncbi:UDP-N-acetyl glucosamine 2-epimerase [Thiosulfatimonas sediminis]|uniref:UDP-N-acetyl glucosamine 2-epimerase n=1 Tax=Thiosulfatimonas sediminis TaxID=2675054 RepID=A0A6F8PTR6_9GAMM|nr:UDP-N-acetylglucosamine 2-epimerase [Thiosulfatimonas sediminis]BBP45521.1 UDP-N-acetyl glucosamine 2-epimerase [Thiosulfatimonas sediminis]
MPKPYRIALVTSGRADYGLLKPLWLALEADAEFSPSMIATGSHLVAEQGNTLDFLKNEGITPLYTVDMKISGDSAAALGAASGLGLACFAEFFERHDFDLLVILGDRVEMLAVATAALLNRLPIAHIHGGEATFGMLDDAVRHSLTKLSALHFVAHPVYARRVIQMGEAPQRVFTVGAIGLDNVTQIPRLSVSELSQRTGMDWSKPTILLTYHPVTLNAPSLAYAEMQTVLAAALASDLQILVTMPNIDAGGGQIYQAIIEGQRAAAEQLHFVKSLGQQGYLSAMQHCALLLGNSSSGIIEAASFKKPVVNIGERQLGRLAAKNVCHVTCDTQQILNAINQVSSVDFQQSLADLQNPYGQGESAAKILVELKKINLDDRNGLLKKGFDDLPAPTEQAE